MTQSKWNSKRAFFAVVAGLSSQNALADIQYFNQPEMNFWKKPEMKPAIKEGQKPAPTQTITKDALPSSFPWKKYLDPKNEEFFREGEYLPPAPFMEIARNPTDGNIENWFKYLEAKNQLTGRLQEKLVEYAQKHPEKRGSSTPELGTNPPNLAKIMPSKQELDSQAKRFRLRLYFDSKCPHCERMIETLKGISERGYFVELRQIDSDVRVRNRIPFPVVSANKAELKQFQIESVPVLLVGDLKARTYFKIQGYQDEPSVLAALSDFTSKKGGVIP